MPSSFQLLHRLSRRFAGVALIAAAAGCEHQQCHEELLPLPPEPFGSHVRAVQQRQIDGAMADRFTVYRHEWSEGGDRLGEYGNQHLEDIAARAGESDHPVLIERDADTLLNESRREFLVRYLAAHSVADAEHRVVVGRPSASGLAGDEAVEIIEVKPMPTPPRTGGGTSSGGTNRGSSGGGF